MYCLIYSMKDGQNIAYTNIRYSDKNKWGKINVQKLPLHTFIYYLL